MSDEFRPIRPKAVPLSHDVPSPPTPRHTRQRNVTVVLGVALVTGALLLAFVLVPAWLEHGARAPGVATPTPGAVTAPDRAIRPAADTEDDVLPPFQQLQRQQARERAQASLALFVERQIRLEEEMTVGAWGADAYQAAKSLAAAGDESFVQERFDEAIAQYQAAAEALRDLMQHGREVLEQAIADGGDALAVRNREAAATAFELAATIDPDDRRVTEGLLRTAQLPEIDTLLRRARNQELTEAWNDAQQTYERIREIDPQTTGLDEALARVAEGRRRERVAGLLSDGFGHLEAARYDAARRAFRDALALEPGQAVALGALEQIDKQADLARLNELRRRAEAAAAAERWDEAADLYQQALDQDATLRFAQTGRALAQAQARTRTALQRIIDSPDRLSSDTLYQEARDILARAEQLEPRGTHLERQITDVGAILDTYATPVAVLLRSDNRTQVTVSTLGTLGSFSEKRLELRPGAYTLIGSRDGCRDVRTRIVVRPNMSPVDIRCVDTL